jgi:hypothetical protein
MLLDSTHCTHTVHTLAKNAMIVKVAIILKYRPWLKFMLVI